MCWTWDAFDFFTVGMTITDLAETFEATYAEVSWVSAFAWHQHGSESIADEGSSRV